ncbi:MAG: adenylate/guanylate cyclase domain-containing protein, partial [Anaerolineales bacterium]
LPRKLAAILYADVAGYSRLTGADEDATHRALSEYLDLISSIVGSDRGQVMHYAGDAVLAKFDAVVDAMSAAVTIQSELKTRNERLPAGRKVEFRIGVNSGDVIEDRGDIYGDGVNVAARLEALAEPGGICISASVRVAIGRKLDLDYEDMGEQKVKNISEPVRTYRVVMSAAVGREVTESVKPALGLPDKPSIAVLPFANMSNDPEQEYFADGIAEDIITALSHIKQWFVVARNSSFAYKGRNVDIREIAKELGVRYVLEGSIRRAGNRLRITGQLIEADTGTHMWADRFDGDLDDVFALQDKITESVVGAIEPSLRRAEIERSKRKPPENMGAYDLYLRALPYIYAMRPDDNEQALTLLHKAIELDSNYAPALAYLAWAYEQRLVRDWGAYGEDDSGIAVALARRAIEADRDDALVMAAAGFVLVMVARDYEQGLQATERAHELNPNIAFVSLLVGVSQLFGGDPAEALIHFEDAIRVSPSDPGAFFFYSVAALGHLFCGRPVEAYDLAKKSARMYSDWDTTYWTMVPALTQLGRMEEARSAVSKFLELSPTATVSRLRGLLPVRNPESLNLILEGMTIAGLPE